MSTTPYTVTRLREAPDQAPSLGIEALQEIAPHVVRAVQGGPGGIEYLAFGPRHAGDGETFAIEEFWPG